MKTETQESLLHLWVVCMAMQLGIIFVAYMLFITPAHAQVLEEGCEDVCKESTCNIVNTPSDKWDACCECQFKNISPAPEIVKANPQGAEEGWIETTYDDHGQPSASTEDPDDGLSELPTLYPHIVTEQYITEVRSSHDQCKAHYRASVDSIVAWSARALFAESALEDANMPVVQCDVLTDFKDGANGNLWKPVGEGGGPSFAGNPVALVAGAFQFHECTYFNLAGEKQGDCAFTSIANGGRAHFRNTRRCGELDAGMLQLQKDGVATCFDVPTPCERID